MAENFTIWKNTHSSKSAVRKMNMLSPSPVFGTSKLIWFTHGVQKGGANIRI